jgi:hypothetical protein
MKRLSMLAVFVSFAFAPGLAFAHSPPQCGHEDPGESLVDAAHDLTYAARQLSLILSSRGPTDLVYQDAVTLYDAADHFEEEVLLGPEDLDVDFAAIEATFDDMRDEIRNAPCVQHDATARSAWFQIAEANLRLRISWFAHLSCHIAPLPPACPLPLPEPGCHAPPPACSPSPHGGCP